MFSVCNNLSGADATPHPCCDPGYRYRVAALSAISSVAGVSQLPPGLGYLSSIVHKCLHLSSFCDENSPYKKGPKGHKCAQWQTTVHELQSVALSPHLDFPHNKQGGSTLTHTDLQRQSSTKWHGNRFARIGPLGAFPGSALTGAARAPDLHNLSPARNSV